MTQVFEQAVVLHPVAGKPRVGKVHTDVVIRNHRDEILGEQGLIGPSQVREIRLDHVLADTGADTLCLPQDLVDQLGLPIGDEIIVTTENGIATSNLYGDAHITILGRHSVFECIALPVGSEPLLGVIPMEMLGLEPDLSNQVLRVLPRTGRSPHLRA